MNSYKVTYHNSKNDATNSVIVKARSLASAIAAEEASMALFQRVNPALSLVSVEAI